MKQIQKIYIMLICLITILPIVFFISCSNEKTPEQQKTYYTVTFDSDGGTSVNQQVIESGKTIISPNNPTKIVNQKGTPVEYAFDGWYNGTTKWNFDTMVITSNITLKAKWKLEWSKSY